MDISGNTVLITGGATGIGYAFAEYFLKTGNESLFVAEEKKGYLKLKRNIPNSKSKFVMLQKKQIGIHL